MTVLIYDCSNLLDVSWARQGQPTGMYLAQLAIKCPGLIYIFSAVIPSIIVVQILAFIIFSRYLVREETQRGYRERTLGAIAPSPLLT